MNMLKNIVILVVVLFLSYYFSEFVGSLYGNLFKDYGGFIDVTALIGLPLSYIFFLILLFTAFGGSKKYWWIGILLIPAAIFELYFDLAHLYFPIILSLAGWVLGFMILKIIQATRMNSIK